MKGQPRFRIGHLKITDHLILGAAAHDLAIGETDLHLSRLHTRACHSWEQLCDLLSRGEVNGAFITIPAAMDLFAKGLDIRMLMFTHRGGGIILKKNTPTSPRLKDFSGRTVLVPYRLSVQHMLCHRLLSTAGLSLGSHSDDTADVFWEASAPYIMPQMLAFDTDDDIAGCTVSEPFGSQAVMEETAVPVCRTAGLWDNHPDCAFVLAQECITHHPDAVHELVSLFVRSAGQINTDKHRILSAIGQAFLDQPDHLITRLTEATDICFDPTLLAPDPEPLNTIQDYMTDTMKVLQKKIDLNTFIDPSFISAKELEPRLEN